jgi:hypothetical protein
MLNHFFAIVAAAVSAAKFCGGSRVGCVRLDFAGDTPAATAKLETGWRSSFTEKP